LCIAAAILALVSMQTGMTQVPSHPDRNVARKIAPFYPEIAKRHRIRGVVKLEVTVERDGTVKSTRALGGSPLLIESAEYAVRQWRFEAAPKETTEIIQIAFDYANSE
jgi:protein TonB